LKQKYKVIENFDTKKDYGIKIRNQYARCLCAMNLGEVFDARNFTEKHLHEFTLKTRTFHTNRQIVYQSITIGKKVGMLEALPLEKLGIYMSFEDFCNLESVRYFMEQLRGSRYRNIDPKKGVGTSHSYGYRLWHFNNWLHGRAFEFHTEVQKENNTYERMKKKITIDDVEQLLTMYQEPYRVASDFAKVIKTFLLDPIHEEKRAGSVNIDYYPIKSYFDKNDSPLSS